jgi:hypothetical protein
VELPPEPPALEPPTPPCAPPEPPVLEAPPVEAKFFAAGASSGDEQPAREQTTNVNEIERTRLMQATSL